MTTPIARARKQKQKRVRVFIAPHADTFAPLSQTPFPGPITLAVNGRCFFAVGEDAAFSVSGQVLTWTSKTFSVVPGDDVVANYYYLAG